MKRRQFLKTASLAAAGTAAVAAPAIAQSAPEVKWRVTTSFPRSLDTIHGAAETVAKYVSDATDGKFQMQVFAGGEIVPAMDRGLLDAAEFNNASSDNILGFPDVSKVCMLQSYHQNAEQFEIMFNKTKFDALPAKMRAIIENAVRLGHSLGMKVVAEVSPGHHIRAASCPITGMVPGVLPDHLLTPATVPKVMPVITGATSAGGGALAKVSVTSFPLPP